MDTCCLRWISCSPIRVGSFGYRKYIFYCFSGLSWCSPASAMSARLNCPNIFLAFCKGVPDRRPRPVRRDSLAKPRIAQPSHLRRAGRIRTGGHESLPSGRRRHPPGNTPHPVKASGEDQLLLSGVARAGETSASAENESRAGPLNVFVERFR